MDKDLPQTSKEEKSFKLTTGWTLPATQDMYFDNYGYFTHQKLMQELSKPPNYNRNNLTKREKKPYNLYPKTLTSS